MEKVRDVHLQRKAFLYIRQSSPYQVRYRRESRMLQQEMEGRLRKLGWRDIEIIDEDLGRTANGTVDRTGFERMVAEVCLGNVGVVAAREVPRLARNSREWNQLIDMCSVVDTVLVDEETIYDARLGNDRLFLGIKGSLSEYELYVLRQRAEEARRRKAARGELVMVPPAG